MCGLLVPGLMQTVVDGDVGSQVVEWDEGRGAVAAVQRFKIGEIVVRERAERGAVDQEAMVGAVVGAVRNSGLEMLHWSEGAR